MKKCYRVENSEGHGPFTYTVSKRFQCLIREAYLSGQHPAPNFKLNENMYAIFAFKKFETIFKWFSDDMIEELHKNHYVINEYKVKAFSQEDDVQVTFNHAGAKLVRTHSLCND